MRGSMVTDEAKRLERSTDFLMLKMETEAMVTSFP